VRSRAITAALESFRPFMNPLLLFGLFIVESVILWVNYVLRN
jgi:hypothetical protein